jgi:TIR domain
MRGQAGGRRLQRGFRRLRNGWRLNSGEEPTTEASSSEASSSADSLSIFISHRREDSAVAWLMYDRLAHHFGSDSVFLDLRELVPGVGWLEKMLSRKAGSLVFIALIGNQSTASLIRQKQAVEPGTDEPLREIEVALRAPERTTVMPVLIDDATIPAAEALPPAIRSLASFQCLQLRSMHLDEDVGHLIARDRGAGTEPGGHPGDG